MVMLVAAPQPAIIFNSLAAPFFGAGKNDVLHRHIDRIPFDLFD